MALDYKKKVQSANASTTNLLRDNVRLVRQLGEVHGKLAEADAAVDQLTTDLVAQERRLGELAIAAVQLENLTLQLAALEATEQAPACKSANMSSSSFRDECQRLEVALSGLTDGTRGLCMAGADPNGGLDPPEAAGGGIKLDFSTAQQQDHASLSTLSVPTSDSLSTCTTSDNTNSTNKNSITHETHYHNFQYMPPVLQGPVIHPSVSKLHAVGTTTSGLSCRDNNKNLTKQNRSVRRVMSLPLKSNQNDYTANEVYASEDFSSSSLTTITSLSTYSDYEGGADEEEEYDVLDMFLRKATVPSSALVSTTTAIVTSSSTSTDDGFKSSNVNQQQKETGHDSTGLSGASSTTQVIEGLLSRHESKRSSEIGLTSMSQVSAEFSPPILSEESESGSSSSAAGPGHRKVTSKASQLLNQTIAEDHCSEGSKAQQDGPSLNKKLSSFFNKFV